MENARAARRPGRFLGDERAPYARPRFRDADLRVEDFAGARVDGRRADREAGVGRDEPAHRRVARVERVEWRVGLLLLHHDRVLEADPLECLVPLEDARAHRGAVFLGNVRSRSRTRSAPSARQSGGRILLLQAPVVGEVGLGGEVRVRREIPHFGVEMPDPRVAAARLHRLRKRSQVVGVPEEDIARVGQVLERRERIRRDRRRRRARQRRLGIAVVRRHRERRLVGRAPQRFEARVPSVERVVALMEAGREAIRWNVCEEQRVGVDQHFAFRRLRSYGSL